MNAVTTFLIILLGSLGATLRAQTPVVEVVNIGIPAGNLTQPVDLTGAGDGSGRLFIVEKPGRIRTFDLTTGTLSPTNFMSITGRVRANGNEQGLLGLAFHPDFANNGYFYVNYTTRTTADFTRISRFSVNPQTGLGDPASELILLEFRQPYSNHNAGDLAFGPDGFLYIPVGDGGSGGDPLDAGQDPNTFLGKMLRIDVDNPSGGNNYGIPVSNPFVNDPNILSEIWALGLRNPWRISFDRETGDLWIGDVGQNAREEINKEPAGSAGGLNYGWDCREGFIAYSGSSSNRCIGGSVYTEPNFDYQRNNSTGGFSVTGGFVYRGRRADDLRGYYLAADYVSDNFFVQLASSDDPNTVSVQRPAGITNVSTFGEDDEGNLYAASLDGPIYEVRTALALPATLTEWKAQRAAKFVELSWVTATEEGVADYVIERSADGINFTEIATVAARNQTEQTYDYLDSEAPASELFYRLRTRDYDGTEEVATVRRVQGLGVKAGLMVLVPNPAGERVSIQDFPGTVGERVQISLFDAGGRQVLSQVHLWADAGVSISVRELPAGAYQLLLQQGNSFAQQRLFIAR